jgi:hypothetical protein
MRIASVKWSKIETDVGVDNIIAKPEPDVFGAGFPGDR